MKNRLLALALIALMLTGAGPKELKEKPLPQLMRVTCYTWTGNRTASGVYPYEGICAGRREDIGKVAVVYDRNMNYIGHFQIMDTGGAPRLQNGTSIDIYRDTISGCYEWVGLYGDYLYVQIREVEN